MFSTLRTRFGIPGVISVIALVFAMFGGAYAASNSSGGGKATASAKAKKGPRGPKGATGPAGPQGPVGPLGPAGAKGDAGANGSNGTNGAPGTSVTNTALAKGNVNCPEGGAEFKVGAGTPTRACNGVTGFTSTLPSGETETGTWSIGLPSSGIEFQAPISFPIPLAEPGKAFFFTPEKVANQEFGSSGCKWEQESPDAKPESTTHGTLCVFDQFGELNVSNGPIFGIPGNPGAAEEGFGPSGAYMTFQGKGEPITAAGTWAVTAK